MDFNFESLNRENLNDDLPAVIWDFEDKAVLQGYFKGTIDNVPPNGTKAHKFEVAENEEVGVWGTTQLDRILAKAEINKAYEIKFEGLKDVKHNPEYKFKKFSVSLLK